MRCGWGDSGSVAALPALGTLCAGIETMNMFGTHLPGSRRAARRGSPKNGQQLADCLRSSGFAHQ